MFLTEFTIYEVIIIFVIVTVGSVLQGCLGFGLGPIAVPLLVMIDPVFIPGPLLLVAIFLVSLIYMRERHAADTRDILWAVIGRTTGTILGAILLLAVPKDRLSLLFGIMVLVALIFFSSGFKLPVNRTNLISAGILSGFMGIASSIGGAPMALLYKDKEGPKLRGTLSGIFIIGTLIALITLIIINRFGMPELKASVLLIPGIILGFFLSKYATKYLDRGFIRPAILIVSAGCAALLIIKHFT